MLNNENEKQYVSQEQALTLPISLYNELLERQWILDKKSKNLSGNLGICPFCQRKKVISCICDEGQKAFEAILIEVKEVSENKSNNNG